MYVSVLRDERLDGKIEIFDLVMLRDFAGSNGMDQLPSHGQRQETLSDSVQGAALS
jgi:hypothetical protein